MTAHFVPPRADFEILSRTVYGKPLVYLDSAASAQKPRHVLDAMHSFATSEYANVHRGVHYLSAMATQRYEAARETVREFVNAQYRKKSSLPKVAPRRSIWSPRLGRRRASVPATKSC